MNTNPFNQFNNESKLRVKYLTTLGGEAWTPTRAYPDDAGFDLYTSERTEIRPGQFVDIPTNIAVELPYWAWGMLTGRSSTLRKRGLLVHTGIIDAGYRGELYAGAFNLTDAPVVVEQGERVAQFIVIQNATADVDLEVLGPDEHFNPHPRGTQGFGSSGK